jgi:hypothetical protein
MGLNTSTYDMNTAGQQLHTQQSVPLSQHAHHALQDVRLAPPPPLSQKAEQRVLSAAIGLTLRMFYILLEY